jgi:hypothetical protein
VGIITNTSRSENSSSSLQKEEIIENASNPTYSPDGKSFSYVKRVDNKEILIKDGVSSQQYDSILYITYSPDSKSFAYVAKIGNKEVLIKD